VQREKLPDEYDKILTDGMNYQMKADSLNAVSTEYRTTINRLPEEQRQAYSKRITATDSLAAEYQKQADQKLGADTNMMNVNKDVTAAVRESAQTAKPVHGQAISPVNDAVNRKSTDASKPQAGETAAVFSLFDILTSPASTVRRLKSIGTFQDQYRIQMGSSAKLCPFFQGIPYYYNFRMIRYFAGCSEGWIANKLC
jgi:hypothetical protein